MANDPPSAPADPSLPLPFVAVHLQQTRPPFWQVQDPQSQVYSTKTLPSSAHFAVPDLHPHGYNQAVQPPAAYIAMQGVDGRGVVASRPSSTLTKQFATRNLPPHPGDRQPHVTYSSVSSLSSQNAATGLQLFTESPESSLLDPQASSPPPHTSKQVTVKGFPRVNQNSHTETAFSAAFLEAAQLESTQNAQPSSAYPPPLASQQEVEANRQLFIDTLSKLHAVLNIHARVPKRGGKELDLHTLYRAVTAQGGLREVVKFDRWDEVILALDLPPQASSPASFLQKHYISLLHHYEQVYYFRVEGQLVPPPDDLEPAKKMRKKYKTSEMRTDDLENSVGRSVTGSIEGKFEHGYLVTVVVGTERMRGILYHVPSDSDTPQFASVLDVMNKMGSPETPLNGQVGKHRRKSRVVESMKKDPNAPKSSRSAYNFFFAEQRTKLKTDHPQNRAEVTKRIGELWHNLTPEERTPYLQRGLLDKERYQNEKKEYEEKLKMQIEIRDDLAIPANSESLEDPGQGPKQSEQGVDHGFAEANGNDEDYHVSLYPDLDTGTCSLSLQQGPRTQMFGDHISEGHLQYIQDHGYPISDIRNQTHAQPADNEDEEDGDDDEVSEEDGDDEDDGDDVPDDGQFVSSAAT